MTEDQLQRMLNQMRGNMSLVRPTDSLYTIQFGHTRRKLTSNSPENVLMALLLVLAKDSADLAQLRAILSGPAS